MEKHNFVYKGVSYPARITMGACRRFRRETGEDFLKLGDRITGEDLGVILWASICSQSKAEGIEFKESLDDFFDNVTPDEVASWYNSTGQVEANEPEDSKKKNIPV